MILAQREGQTVTQNLKQVDTTAVSPHIDNRKVRD